MAEERVLTEVEAEEMSGARPGTDASIVIQLLAGLVGTVGTAIAVYPLRNMAPGIAYIYGIVNERGPVQYFELFMAFMVFALVILKSRIIRNQLSVVAEGPIELDIDLSNDDEITEVRRKVRSDDAYSWSILLNRIDRMLALWLSTKDVGRIAAWAGSESERDAGSSDSTYAIARVLIWAIPILGFIGTVVGLGSAVSGFSDFLAGAAGLDAIKEAIGDVTQGLGMAFDTTLLALVLSVFLMFPLSVVQRREENLFVEIDNYLDDMLLSRFPAPEQQPIVIENLEDSIEAAFRRYIPDPDRYEEVFTNAIGRAGSVVEERFGLLAKSYESTLNDLTERLSTGIATVGDSMESAMRKIVDDMQTEQDGLLERRKALVAEELEQFKALGTELQQASSEMAAQYRESAESLSATTRESAEKSLQAAEEMSQRMQDVVELASGIQELLKIESAVERGLTQIAASDELQKTLHSIRSHLETTDDFCKRISRPRIITLREEAG
jgi:biopolymer transport protein ExbB/TolQ